MSLFAAARRVVQKQLSYSYTYAVILIVTAAHCISVAVMLPRQHPFTRAGAKTIQLICNGLEIRALSMRSVILASFHFWWEFSIVAQNKPEHFNDSICHHQMCWHWTNTKCYILWDLTIGFCQLARWTWKGCHLSLTNGETLDQWIMGKWSRSANCLRTGNSCNNPNKSIVTPHGPADCK